MAKATETLSREITFESGELTLEGALHLPERSGRVPGVVVCHPNPRRGGDMDNGVVVALTRSICNAGVAALRFNFRGIGKSGGSHDRGVGEVQDALAAVDFLALHDRIETSRVGIAGYSFGARIALEACAQSGGIQAVASVACPVGAFTELGAREMLQPKLLVCGDRDHDFPADQFRFLARRFDEPKEVELMSGADHFFAGRQEALAEIVAGFFAGRLGNGD